MLHKKLCKKWQHWKFEKEFELQVNRNINHMINNDSY